MKTLWRVKEVSKSFHSFMRNQSLPYSCLVQSPFYVKIFNVHFSQWVFKVLIMPRTGSIFFWFRPFICAPEGFRMKNWRTWWNLAKISSEHCANYNSRWLHYILALHFIIELPFGSTYYHQVTVHGISYYKGKANIINYHKRHYLYLTVSPHILNSSQCLIFTSSESRRIC